MKKSCLLTMAIVPCITGVATAATMRETCLSRPDLFVWVENSNDCAKIHPCENPSDPHYQFYCNTAFADVQVASSREAQELANLYVTKKMNLSGGCNFLTVDKAKIIGQDYIRCKTPNGGYIEFMFDDYSESSTATAEYSYQVGRCIAYGGIVDTRYTSDSIGAPSGGAVGVISAGVGAAHLNNKRGTISCHGVSESACSEMYSGAAGYNQAERVCTKHI